MSEVSILLKPFSNNLVISNQQKSIAIPQPWHCGQFQDGKSSILFYQGDEVINEISFEDNVGLFTREIEHASDCIINNKIESELISHIETQSNMFWLDQWRQKMEVIYPKDSLEYSPVLRSKTYVHQPSLLEKMIIPGLSKSGSRLALGCDNQTSELHAFTMFDHFFGAGGRIFDSAFIYNNGMGDKYLGKWMSSRGVQAEVIVIGKAAHTPHCEPKFIRPQIIESLERLQTAQLDIFCLHRDNPEVPVSEFVDASFINA